MWPLRPRQYQLQQLLHRAKEHVYVSDSTAAALVQLSQVALPLVQVSWDQRRCLGESVLPLPGGPSPWNVVRLYHQQAGCAHPVVLFGGMVGAERLVLAPVLFAVVSVVMS